MFTNLEWLPTAGADFRARLAMLQAEQNAGPQDGFYERVVGLATVSADETQLRRLAQLSGAIQSANVKPPGFLFARIGLVGDGTLSLIGPPVVGSGLRHGMLLEVIEGGYGSAVQEAADPQSALHSAELDFLLIATDARLLGLDCAAHSRSLAQTQVDTAFEHIQRIASGYRPAISSGIIVQTVVPPLDSLFGSLDRVEAGAPFAMVEALNRKLVDWAAEGGAVLLDVARLASTVGLESWEEPRHWHASKLSFSPNFVPIYGELVARTVAAIRGRSRKCLVLDLDNTLWGGVIGDDGVTGIVLGQGSATGEAFLAIQRMALELRARGIPLAVCSKNEDEAARLPFREHPDMLLKEEHVAVFHANWTDKAANLRAIAQTLNIGVDALVFLDDNPAERMQVRRELPLAAVPELPEDVSLYPRALAAGGYFETVAFSEEDRQRASFYQDNAKRAAALTATNDIEGYLASLDMKCSIGRVDAISRSRVAQLINKSNQYNLTTRRYSEDEVKGIEFDADRHAIQIRLADRFGDNGIISVIIVGKSGDVWEIDVWLMSCRVLGRRVEEAALAHLVRAGLASGATSLIGRYIPTPKNKMVEAHYRKLGFNLIDSTPDGATVWRLDLNAYHQPDLPLAIEDHALTTLVEKV
jgi:FkbH-like protein